MIPIEKWGRDHWSIFAYAATRCVDHEGKLDRAHLRLNGDKYPSVLKGRELAENHNDPDCLRDCQEAGLLKYNPPSVELTDEGWRVWLKLQQHKAAGGMFASFEKDQ